MIKNCALFFSVLAVIAITQKRCLSQEPMPTSVVREEYFHAYNLHDADAVLALYADDAVLLSEAGVFQGKPEIRKWLQFAFDQDSVLESITATREKSSDILAYGTGRTKRLVGKEIHRGCYLIVMEERDGRWRIVEHAALNAHE